MFKVIHQLKLFYSPTPQVENEPMHSQHYHPAEYSGKSRPNWGRRLVEFTVSGILVAALGSVNFATAQQLAYNPGNNALAPVINGASNGIRPTQTVSRNTVGLLHHDYNDDAENQLILDNDSISVRSIFSLLKKLKPKPPIKPVAPGARPSPKQSEIDIGKNLGSNYRPQVSYLNGKEVPYGTKGSVRPDYVSKDGSVSFEIKNYDIQKNSSSLINNASQQAIKRADNLPKGANQNIIVDVRKQNVSKVQEQKIAEGIVKKSNGIIQLKDITFHRQ